MTLNSQNQKCSSINYKHTGVLFVLFLSTCLWSAEIVSGNHDLIGVPENDLRTETNTKDPNNSIIGEALSTKTIAAINAEESLSRPELHLPVQAGIKEPNPGTKYQITASAQPTSAVNESVSAISVSHDSMISKNPTTPVQQELWRARISASPGTDMSISQNELNQLINQINSIEIKPQRQPQLPEPQAAVQSVTETEPNDTASDRSAEMAMPGNLDTAGAENNTPDGAVSPETLQRLKELSQNPDQLNNPAQLAEILYHGNCLSEAAVCYQAALNRLNDENSGPLQDKAWILLQLGNCLKNQNPEAAREKYQSVINEFPLSPWAQLAKAKSDAIDWFLMDQPEKVLSESRKKITQ